jgi:hypothetical protein
MRSRSAGRVDLGRLPCAGQGALIAGAPGDGQDDAGGWRSPPRLLRAGTGRTATRAPTGDVLIWSGEDTAGDTLIAAAGRDRR